MEWHLFIFDKEMLSKPHNYYHFCSSVTFTEAGRIFVYRIEAQHDFLYLTFLETETKHHESQK